MSERVITIECRSSDPLELRAENIVKCIGFQGHGAGWSIPQISPAEAILRALKILRKYQECDDAPPSTDTDEQQPSSMK